MENEEITKVFTIHSEGDECPRQISTAVHRCWDITLKTTNVNLMVALEEKAGYRQSHLETFDAFPSTCFYWSANIEKVKKQVKRGGKVGVFIKRKCDQVQWKQIQEINNDVHEASAQLTTHKSEHIRCVWSDEETLTFLKLIHETNINAVMISRFFPNIWGLTGTLKSHCVLFFCNGIMAPDWSISATYCLSQWTNS